MTILSSPTAPMRLMYEILDQHRTLFVAISGESAQEDPGNAATEVDRQGLLAISSGCG